MTTKKVMLSGMRPSGFLHLGNYLGALHNWVQLQDEYRCYFFVADWHALTTDYEDTSHIKESIKEMVLDWLSAGLDPDRSVIFRQSDIKEHAELYLLFSMFTPISWLERCPTFKEILRQLEGRELHTHGFLGYPLLQAADILIYKADAVPVGEDQAPHVEITREVARRFNHLYGPVFPEPETKLNHYPLIPGIDGRKMSKSYDNYIRLAEEPDDIPRKVRMMITDPGRVRKNDPGNPEVCTVHMFHNAINAEEVSRIGSACRTGEVGCVECKEALSQRLISFLQPVYEKRQELKGWPAYLEEVLEHGAQTARRTARETLVEVREAMGL